MIFFHWPNGHALAQLGGEGVVARGAFTLKSWVKSEKFILTFDLCLYPKNVVRLLQTEHSAEYKSDLVNYDFVSFRSRFSVLSPSEIISSQFRIWKPWTLKFVEIWKRLKSWPVQCKANIKSKGLSWNVYLLWEREHLIN